MIEINGSAWTDPKETLDLHEYFFTKYGKEVAEPCCHVCKKTTCYVVEKVRLTKTTINFEKKGMNLLFKIAHPRALIKDGMAYLPMGTCDDCDAKAEAERKLRNNDDMQPDLKSRNMTMVEKERYRNVFNARADLLRKQRAEKIGEKASKYKI